MSTEEKLHWCSFAGEEFNGVVITTGTDPIGLASKAHRLGINPGGEMLSFEIPDEYVKKIPPEYRDKLLNRNQLEGLDALMGGTGLVKGSAEDFVREALGEDDE